MGLMIRLLIFNLKTNFKYRYFYLIILNFHWAFGLDQATLRPNVSNLTGLPVYYRMSLFDKVNFSYSSSTGYTSVDSGSFVFYEECRDDGFNVLKIVLIGSDFRETNVETEKYETGKFHHFWIA
jgi:hypothetical protein